MGLPMVISVEHFTIEFKGFRSGSKLPYPTVPECALKFKFYRSAITKLKKPRADNESEGIFGRRLNAGSNLPYLQQ